ncbi:hypothetical protein [Aphanothece sacrum]|uniref:Uncharacterized protein n=1 Tax=Aphanothece sacrum FPU1 TaxID=1920663 RepID=A0A401ICE8_APHSA|nr:hypothetical protein [Aphanothece sacrum]GBF78912.1 hypothetical protein AsFPU1_0303 [Aphanothece sacrum FPU1]GBF86741.1 hypothetical protein AsFPU3_3814 [Aphanothece sacrum FPU3]
MSLSFFKEIKSTVKSLSQPIRCTVFGCGKHHLELGKRAEENDWQLVLFKIKNLDHENILILKKFAYKLAKETGRPICDATGHIEPWTDDILTALKNLEYNYQIILIEQQDIG